MQVFASSTAIYGGTGSEVFGAECTLGLIGEDVRRVRG